MLTQDETQLWACCNELISALDKKVESANQCVQTVRAVLEGHSVRAFPVVDLNLDLTESQLSRLWPKSAIKMVAEMRTGERPMKHLMYLVLPQAAQFSSDLYYSMRVLDYLFYKNGKTPELTSVDSHDVSMVVISENISQFKNTIGQCRSRHRTAGTTQVLISAKSEVSQDIECSTTPIGIESLVAILLRTLIQVGAAGIIEDWYSSHQILAKQKEVVKDLRSDAARKRVEKNRPLAEPTCDDVES